MYMFPEALLPLVIYLVTQGIKSIFGSISGLGSMLVAAGVAGVLLFGETVVGNLGLGEIANSVVGLLLMLFAGLGTHSAIKTHLGGVRVGEG